MPNLRKQIALARAESHASAAAFVASRREFRQVLRDKAADPRTLLSGFVIGLSTGRRRGVPDAKKCEQTKTDRGLRLVRALMLLSGITAGNQAAS